MKCDVPGCDFWASDEPTMDAHTKRQHGSSLFDFDAEAHPNSEAGE